MERLDKIISSMGHYSRREVRELVRQGRIRVDGALAVRPEQKVDGERAEIYVDGTPLCYKRFTYLMLHKPAGILSAVEDSRQTTVLDLLPPEMKKRGLSPVGRLDKDTEGLLLLTNDGELAHRLLSPRFHVDKVYYAKVDGHLTQEDVTAFAAGVVLSEFTCRSAKLTLLADDACLVTVQEGKFHQVKRMLGSRGKPVLYLKRLSMGPLTLDDALSPGAFRSLTDEEIARLQCAISTE